MVHLPPIVPSAARFGNNSSPMTDEQGIQYLTYLNGNKIYGCARCQTHLASADDLVSRAFRGQHGKAFLFSKVVNIVEGPPDERQMTTGRHIVRDITCTTCAQLVGWKYDRAYEPSEQYKEGKFILEHELLGIVK